MLNPQYKNKYGTTKFEGKISSILENHETSEYATKIKIIISLKI